MDSLSRHTDYGSVALSESDALPDPMAQFTVWLADAERERVYEPNAMVVATVDPDGAPSSRTVLLKGFVPGRAASFDFVTNAGSRKGSALAGEPRVSLLFPWYSLQRQVIVTGVAATAPAEVSDAYWDARPRDSRIGSIASEQSRPIGSRAELEEHVRRVEERFGTDEPVARPADWGAYRVTPTRIEFWQGRTSRLHDRLEYTATGDGGWSIRRLQP